MSNKMIGWIGLKTSFFSRRLSREISFEKDLDLISTLLLAISDISKELINCHLQSITYFNNIVQDNQGLSFRIGRYTDRLLSVVIDEVSTIKEDFMYFEDTRPLDLMDVFYRENEEMIEEQSYYVNKLEEKTYEGEFSKLYEKISMEEKTGRQKYFTELLMIYGVDYSDGTPYYFLNKETGHDFKEYNLSGQKKNDKELLKGLIDTINTLHSNMYIKEKEKFTNAISFLTLKNPEQDKYAIIEYKQKSETVPEKQDTLGILLEVRQDPNGYSLKKTIKDALTFLSENLNKYI